MAESTTDDQFVITVASKLGCEPTQAAILATLDAIGGLFDQMDAALERMGGSIALAEEATEKLEASMSGMLSKVAA